MFCINYQKYKNNCKYCNFGTIFNDKMRIFLIITNFIVILIKIGNEYNERGNYICYKRLLTFIGFGSEEDVESIYFNDKFYKSCII